MKRLFIILGVAALAFFAVSCMKKDAEGGDATTEVNETTLKGTWEIDIPADYAQGYHRKYRITFDGQDYTLWTMHQMATFTEEKQDGIHDVGNKESGSWTFAGGSLTLKAKKMFASYFISNMSPLEYTFYDYNVETMESNPWFETMEELVATMEPTVWTHVSVRNNQLRARINMDNVVFEKK